MRLRSLVLALLCASALALTSDGGSPPGKVDTKPKLQTEPQPPPPRLGVLSATGLGLGKLSPLKCYAMAAPYLKNPMAVPKRLLAFAGLMLFSFYMLLSALTSLASLLIRPQAAPSPSPNPDPNPKSTPNPNPDPSPTSKPDPTLRIRPAEQPDVALCEQRELPRRPLLPARPAEAARLAHRARAAALHHG